MSVVNLRIYNREKYKEYIANIIKRASSTVILMEYLKISNRIKDTLPAGVKLEIKQLKHNHYCIYLRYQNASVRKLYEMLDYLEEKYLVEFPYLNKNAGFVDSGSMYLVLKYFENKL